jgi:hypothetical protein
MGMSGLGGGVGSSPDVDVIKFMNEPPESVPQWAKDNLWGFVTRLQGVTFLTPQEAVGHRHLLYATTSAIKSSVPARRITPDWIGMLENIDHFVILKIAQSTLRPKGMLNERTLDAAGAGNEGGGPNTPRERKGLFGRLG